MPIAQGYPQGCIGSVLYKASWLRGEQAEIPPCSTLPPRLLLSCILEVGVPFLICIRAREDPEIRFFKILILLQEIPKSSIPFLTSNTMGTLLRKRLSPRQRQIHFEDMLFVQWERKKKRGKEKGEREEKNGDEVALLPSELWTHRTFLDTAVKE